MTHDKVYECFKTVFPAHCIGDVKIWFPNGRNSIRIRLVSEDEFIFTINNAHDWCFETREHFLNNLRVRNKTTKQREKENMRCNA